MKITFDQKDCELLEKALGQGFHLQHVENFLKENKGKIPLPALELPRQESINLSQALAFIPKGEGEKLSKTLRKQIYGKH